MGEVGLVLLIKARGLVNENSEGKVREHVGLYLLSNFVIQSKANIHILIGG